MTGSNQCNICQSTKNKLIEKTVFGSPEQSIYGCIDCGHIYLSPLMTSGEEEHFYINEYPDFLLGRGDMKSASPEQHFANNKSEAERRVSHVKHLLLKDKAVLEIGSASGFFLDHICDYVGEICGVEPNSDHFAYAKKKNIPMHKDLKEIGDRKFDIIFLYYVLEHIKDPASFIKNIKKLLRDKNSKIIIEVPNVNEALVSLYKSPAYNKFVWQRAHCNYFSVKILKNLFDGLKLSAEFIPVQRYDFSNHIHWLIEGKPGGRGKYNHIFSDSMNREYKESLKNSWLCDTILTILNLD